jgi:hypothetical protein
MAKYGKDRGGSEAYISEALHGGDGPSSGMQKLDVDRPNQVIMRAHALDNVQCAGFEESTLKDLGGFAGGVTNIGHTLKGATGLGSDGGEAGTVKHKIIPDH